MKNDEKHIVTNTVDGEYQQVKKSEVRFVVDEESPTPEAVQKVANRVASEGDKDKVWSVMMFWQRCEIEDTNSREWVMTKKLHFDSHMAALNCYANTPCPASQIIGAPDEKSLEEKEKAMIENYKNQDWLEENLYPYI